MIDPGQLFMFGAYGMKPSRKTIQLFKSTGATGLLLLSRNIETPAQTKAFIDRLQQSLGRSLLVAIDHEGGWVLRFKKGMTAFPGNAALGRTGDPALAYQVGRQMALELFPLGIRMNLAPVLDVSTKNYNPGIGIRSFGQDPALVGKLGAAFTRGLQDHGVSACAKHFPGKGAATVDAHVDLPTIKLPRAGFIKTHLAPFKTATAAGVDAVMTSHVRFPAFDSVLATFSKKIVGDVLRKKLGYNGLIISDDLCMGAITKRWPIAEATLKCLEAGHDMLMIAHDELAMEDAVHLLRESRVEEKLIKDGVTRITPLLKPRPAPRKPSMTQGHELSKLIAAQAISVVRLGRTKFPIALNAQTLFLIPDFREVKERFTFENGPAGPETFLRRHTRTAKILRTPIESTDLGRLTEAIQAAQRIVFFCFEARRFPGQAMVLKQISALAAHKTVCALIRSSWDIDLCPESMTVIDTAGYRLVSLQSLLEKILEKS